MEKALIIAYGGKELVGSTTRTNIHTHTYTHTCIYVKINIGMEKALIIPYGGKELVESTTRTNTAAWLDYNQDPVVTRLERMLANVTDTQPGMYKYKKKNGYFCVCVCVCFFYSPRTDVGNCHWHGAWYM